MSICLLCSLKNQLVHAFQPITPVVLLVPGVLSTPEDGGHALISSIRVFVRGSKVLMGWGLVTGRNTGIGVQRGIGQGNVVNNRGLRGFSSTGQGQVGH